MRLPVVTFVVTVGVATWVACGGSTATSPSSLAHLDAGTSTDPTITFSGLNVSGAPVTTYTEAGFTVSVTSGTWSARTDYGQPPPFIQFVASPSTTIMGGIQVTAAGSPFYFKSVDLYASVTTIPYTITGLRNSTTVFTLAATLPNTFGDFVSVANPNPAAPIDTLVITLTNAGSVIGLDNIVLDSAPPTPTTTTLSLSGQVTDKGTGAGIPGATVSVAGGTSGGSSTTTDAGGHYRVGGLLPLSYVVSTSASQYYSDTRAITLTSNQTVSFQLTQRPPTPVPPTAPPGGTVIGFTGLTLNRGSVTSYTESGFTVLAISGDWIGWTGYGNPAPAIVFEAPGGRTVNGEIRVSLGGATFGFQSVDLYSSTTKIPYSITGFRNASAVFTLADTLPNTMGNFKTVVNPSATAVVDTLSIVLTNDVTNASPGGSNPMGLDNIVLTK